MITSLGVLLGVIALTAAAHLLLKIGIDRLGPVTLTDVQNPLRTARDVVTIPQILVAVPVYIVSFVGWVIVISRLKLSVAYPGLGLMYAIIPLLSWIVLKESITVLQWGGIVMVVVGVLVVVRVGGA